MTTKPQLDENAAGKGYLEATKITAGASMGASVTSDPVAVAYVDNISFQANFTGTPQGTFSVEGSVDKTIWTEIPLSATPTAAGVADTALISLEQLTVPWVRLVYTRTSGTGSLDIWVSGKGV